MNRRVEQRFDRVDADLREIKVEMNARFNSLQGNLNSLQENFNSMQRMLLQVTAGGLATLCAALIALVASQL